MATQVVPYEFVPDIRRRAEELRMSQVRQAVRGSIQAHSITADKIAVGVLNVGSGAVTIDNGAITGDKLAVNSVTAAKIDVSDLSDIGGGTLTAGTVIGGSITGTTITGVDITGSSSITGGTLTGTDITGSTITLGNIKGNTTGIYANGDGASYRFFDSDGGTRTGAMRANIPINGGIQTVQVEVVGYIGLASDVATSACLRIRDGSTDAETGYLRVFGDGVVGGSSTYHAPSDRKLKAAIKDVRDPLDAVLKLRPRTYRRKRSGADEAGFVAQEVQEVLPDLVHDAREEEPMLSITYDGFHAYTVGAIQEIVGRLEALERG